MAACYVCKGSPTVGKHNLCRECDVLRHRYEKLEQDLGFDPDDARLMLFIKAFTQGEEEGKLESCEQCEELAPAAAGITKWGLFFCDAECVSTYDNERGDEPDDYLIDGVGFADPGGESALRAATADNPRNLPCPTCGAPNRLTPLDRKRGYQCDRCADLAERGGW